MERERGKEGEREERQRDKIGWREYDLSEGKRGVLCRSRD